MRENSLFVVECHLVDIAAILAGSTGVAGIDDPDPVDGLPRQVAADSTLHRRPLVQRDMPTVATAGDHRVSVLIDSGRSRQCGPISTVKIDTDEATVVLLRQDPVGQVCVFGHVDVYVKNNQTTKQVTAG